ncbi:hypothetical protein Sa4125_23000 [Aureimonas sp. SA4125]|nr:hypothetical protein Sa4125_23000 [Aureimonas sp. SA4125]
MKLAASALALLALGGCVAPSGDTPRVPHTPFAGASISANRETPGSEEFCRQFALQSAADRFEQHRDSHSGSGFARALGEAEGERAFIRCRTGNTGGAPGTLGSLIR